MDHARVTIIRCYRRDGHTTDGHADGLSGARRRERGAQRLLPLARLPCDPVREQAFVASAAGRSCWAAQVTRSLTLAQNNAGVQRT